jgi:hypothetical protein
MQYNMEIAIGLAAIFFPTGLILLVSEIDKTEKNWLTFSISCVCILFGVIFMVIALGLAERRTKKDKKEKEKSKQQLVNREGEIFKMVSNLINEIELSRKNLDGILSHISKLSSKEDK